MESGNAGTPQLGLGQLLESLSSEDLQALLLSQARRMEARNEADDPAARALNAAKSLVTEESAARAIRTAKELVAKSRPVRAASALSEAITGEDKLSPLLAAKEAQAANKVLPRPPLYPAPAVAGLLGQNSMQGTPPVPPTNTAAPDNMRSSFPAPPPTADSNFARGDSARFDTEMKPLSTTPSSNPTVVSTPTRVAESISPAATNKVANYDYSSMDPYASYGLDTGSSMGLSLPELTTNQALGLGAAGLVATSPTVKAKRDMQAVRRAYSHMAANQVNDRGAVKALNKELALLGSKARLSGNTASSQLAAAELKNAERSLASSIRNSRFKRLMPLALIAAAAPKIYQEFQRGSQYEY